MSVQPITDEQARLFDALRDQHYTNFALISTALDGEPTAAIATVDYDGDSREYIITPVAVFITDAMMERLTPPDEGLDRG